MARVTQNTDITITPGDSVPARNCLSRVFIDGAEAFEVIVRTPTDEILVTKGRGVASRGKKCALYIKTRAEADVDEPAVEPAVGEPE